MVGSRLGNLPIVRELLSHPEIDVNAVDNVSLNLLHLLPSGSEEREVLGDGSIPVAMHPSCQDMEAIAS